MDQYNQKKRGAPKKYKTPAAFRRAVEKYFAGISTVLAVEDPYGKPIKNADGEIIRKLVYAVPPSIEALSLSLGFTERTWDNYKEREGYAEICEDAKLRIKAYLVEQLNMRERPQGIIFNLQNNFQMAEKRDVNTNVRHQMGLSEMRELLLDVSREMEEDGADED